MGNTFYSVSVGGIYCTNYSYPFGSLLPGRSLNPTNYRYSYQNQEKDNETGYHNFQLRQYASLLGRWMTPDPYGQHHSPYLAMSNNPVSAIDPDGGRDCYIDGMMVPCSAADNYMNNNTAGTDFGVDFAGFAYGTAIGHRYNGQAYYGSRSFERAADARQGAVNKWMDTYNTSLVDGRYIQTNIKAEHAIDVDRCPDCNRYENTYVDATDFVENFLSGFGRNDTWGNGVFDFGNNTSGEEFLQTLGLVYSAFGVIGDNRLKSGEYKQLNGKQGNFNNKPYKKLSNWGKANKTFAQNLSKLGGVANGLVIATAVYDALDDGNIKTSTVINVGLMALSVAVPVTAPAIIIYGVFDLTFGFSKAIDSSSKGINTGIYDK